MVRPVAGTVSLVTLALGLGLLVPAVGAAQASTPNPAVRPRMAHVLAPRVPSAPSTPAPLPLHHGLALGDHARNLHLAAGASLALGLCGVVFGALLVVSSDSLHDLGVAGGLVGSGLVLAGTALVLGVVAIVLERF